MESQHRHIVLVGMSAPMLSHAIHTMAPDVLIVMVNDETPTDKPKPPTLTELANIITLQEINAVACLQLPTDDRPEDRLTTPPIYGRIVDNAEASGANSFAATALGYGPRNKRTKQIAVFS